MSYNLNRGKELFENKINEISCLINDENKDKFYFLANHFSSNVGVMQEGSLGGESFTPSYSRLATSIAGAAQSGITDEAALIEDVMSKYSSGGCEHYDVKRTKTVSTQLQIENQIVNNAAHEELSEHGVQKKTWTEVVIVRDENGDIIYDENGVVKTDVIEVSNTTTVYTIDDDGNTIEEEILLDDIDLMEDFDESDMTTEGLRSAGLIASDHDTLTGHDAVRTGIKERLPLGQIVADENIGWKIICPFTGSSDVYQIRTDTYASYLTDQPFRIDLSLADNLSSENPSDDIILE
jgi:hypothetical protein